MPLLLVLCLISMLSLSEEGDIWMGCGTEMLFEDNTNFLLYYCAPTDRALTPQPDPLPDGPLQPMRRCTLVSAASAQLARVKLWRCLFFFGECKGQT